MTDIQVYVVDDDPKVLTALMRLLNVAGYKTRAFSSASEFLEEHEPSIPGCAIFDLAMPGCNGLELQERLAETHSQRPIVFLSGHASVPESVRALQAGAVDFLLKPINDTELLNAVDRAVARDQKSRQMQQESSELLRRLGTLTRREHEVLTHVIAGWLNKQIAAELGTVEKTIKVHRGRMMAKMGVRSVADLVRMTEHAGVMPATPAGQRHG